MPANNAIQSSAMLIIALVTVNLISGSANTLVAKQMDDSVVAPFAGGEPEKFSHPFVQTVVMMMGEAAVGIAFLATCLMRGQSPSTHMSKAVLLFALPSCLDWTTSTMVYVGQEYLPASTVQMLRGSLVIFVFLVSVFLLKNKQYAHHLVGVVLCAMGITFVAMSELFQKQQKKKHEDDSKQDIVLGLVIVISSQVVAALLMTSEEKIFRYIGGDFPTMLAIAAEGTFGLIIGAGVLGVTGSIGVEQPGQAVYQITHSQGLAIATAGLCLSIAFFNVSGVGITKRVSATARALVDSSRPLLVWFVDLYRQQTNTDLSDPAFYLKPLGFLFSVVGTFLYFNIIKVERLMGQEELEEGLLNDEELHKKDIETNHIREIDLVECHEHQ